MAELRSRIDSQLAVAQEVVLDGDCDLLTSRGNERRLAGGELDGLYLLKAGGDACDPLNVVDRGWLGRRKFDAGGNAGVADDVWFAFKDPDVLPSTVFWIENHGRHGSPWNGRNNCLGIEDVCAFFAEGLAASTQPNLVSNAGIPTSIELSPSKPTTINYIQGIARIPAGFEQVQTVEFSASQATFISTSGQKVTIPVKHEFLRTGQL